MKEHLKKLYTLKYLKIINSLLKISVIKLVYDTVKNFNFAKLIKI